jgi:biotin synthase
MGGDATPATLKAALQLRGGDQESLFAAARERRDAAFPARQVEMRSVIEISNICFQRCKYCAIGGKERNRAYTIGIDEFVERAQVVYDRGRRVLLVQSGENDAQTFVDHVTSAVGELRQRLPEMVVVLCLGNMSRDQYRQLHDAGARRYILKFETSNERLYASLKPRDTLARRLQCLETLVELGFDVGSGNMVGLPGQTLDDMVEDLVMMGRFKLAMSSCTPFIPGEQSALKDEPMGDVHLALNTMAIARILYPDRLIPTTSSLERALPKGQFVGLMAGANTVTIHDGTPADQKDLFPIYSSHRFAPGEAHLRDVVRQAGLTFAEGALR